MTGAWHRADQARKVIFFKKILSPPPPIGPDQLHGRAHEHLGRGGEGRVLILRIRTFPLSHP